MYNEYMTLKLINETICFTGKSKLARPYMEKLAIKHGAKVSRQITKETSLLVMGLRPGSKLDRAFSRGIRLMVDDEFFLLIGE
jgi:DNA ligase (NAD+)